MPQWGVKNNKKIGLSVLRLSGNILVSPLLIGRVNFGVVLPSRVPILSFDISVSVLAIVTCIGNSAWIVVSPEVRSWELLAPSRLDTGEFIHPSNIIIITVARLINVNLSLSISNHVIQPIYW